MSENLIFKRILFKTAFCAMACDGRIDPKEIDELRIMDKKTSYFDDVDLTDELESLVKDFNSNGHRTVEELFQELRSTKLSFIQELLILEVAIRIIYADQKLETNELKFIKFLRSKLEVPNEIILDRFGHIDLLFGETASDNLKINSKYDPELHFKIPDLLNDISFDINKDA